MATQLHLHMTLVVPDGTHMRDVIARMAGRELDGVPGSWIAAAELMAEPASESSEDEDLEYDEVLEAEADADAGLHD